VAARFQDDPWRRLPWVAPLAVLLTILSQMMFLSVLQEPAPHPRPLSVDVRVVELPAEIREPPPPPVRKPEPPPPPKPSPPRLEPKTAPAPTPPPRAQPEVKPLPAPVPQAAPELPKDVSSPPAQAMSEPSRIVASSPAAPQQPSARGPANASAPATTALVPPRPSVSGTPGGTGLGGGKMGARAIYQPLPEIPEALRHRNFEVVAVARFRVAASGSAQVELIEPTGDPDLNRALLDSLRRWRFFPGMEDGKPVTSTVDIRIPISVR
jgi:protein TonB